MIKKLAAMAFGVWCMVFLYTTPRGDRIMTAVGKFLFPDKLCR